MSEEQTVQPEERVTAKQAAAPVERRAATNFWIMLGRPEIADMVTEWPKLMREAMGFMEITDLEEFKNFLHWTLEENAMSAEYLRVAKDPCRSLVKNIESLKRFYLAWIKAQQIRNRKGKPSKPVVVPQPESESQPENENGLVAGYTAEEIAAHAEACKLDPWVHANDTPAARKRPGFVKHLMDTEPPKQKLKTVGGKVLPEYRQESGKNTVLKGNV